MSVEVHRPLPGAGHGHEGGRGKGPRGKPLEKGPLDYLWNASLGAKNSP